MPQRYPRYNYFTALRISNARCFGEDEVLDITNPDGRPARWTLILGENGYGKTTLLQCLEWMRPTIGNPNQTVGMEEKYDLVPALSAVEDNKVLEGLRRAGADGAVNISADISTRRHLASSNAVKKRGISLADTITTTAAIGFTKAGALKQTAWGSNLITDKDKYQEPFVVSYGANRQLGYRNVTQAHLYDPIAPRRLSDTTELFDAEQILSYLDHAAARKRLESGNGLDSFEYKQSERFKGLLCRILPDCRISTVDDVSVSPPNLLGEVPQRGTVSFHTDFGWIPMSALSLGYQTTAAWVIDFAFRLYREYSHLSDPLAGPAVVLIDELDLHLHPRWQLSIIPDLSHLFPRTQFIATAHSPLMVQVAHNANLALVRKNEHDKSTVSIISDPAEVGGWRVDQILTSLFDVPITRDPATEQLIQERDELLKKTQPLTQRDQARLEKLQKLVAKLPVTPYPTEDQERFEFIKDAITLLRKETDG